MLANSALSAAHRHTEALIPGAQSWPDYHKRIGERAGRYCGLALWQQRLNRRTDVPVFEDKV